MKNSLAMLLVLFGTMSTVTLARAGDEAKGKGKAKKGSPVFVPAADMKWNDVPGFAGVQIASVDGDPAKGPSHFFIKFDPGVSAPVHHHTANHYVTVVAGTVVLTVDGQEQKLPSGSFFAFSSKTKHATRCEPAAACVLSLDSRGKWDVVLADDKGSAKK